MLRTKTGIQHAGTLLDNIGPASVPTTFEVLETETGTRTTTGASQITKDSASTAEVVNIGDTVKYINLFIQCCAREGIGSSAEETGWLEWAFVQVKELEATLPITSLGTLTLGTVATNMYRNECIYTGMFPINRNGANVEKITIKVPRFKQKIRIGDEWRLIAAVRSSNSADMNTASYRLIMSFMYKGYS